MYEHLEPRVRHLVAEHLGVRVETLVSRVSLREDLAADSLDLVGLAIALEGEFAIVVSEHILEDVRTYGDLVHATGALIRARCEAAERGAEPPQRIWARIVRAGESRGTLERTGWLTPYIVDTIVEDALQAGPGARVDVTIAASAGDAAVRAQRRFAALGKRGLLVTVGCNGDPPSRPGADCTPEPKQVAIAGAGPL
jgi:acyl carrier protein